MTFYDLVNKILLAKTTEGKTPRKTISACLRRSKQIKRQGELLILVDERTKSHKRTPNHDWLPDFE